MIFADRIAVIVRRCIAVWTGSNRDRSGLDVNTDPNRIRCGSVFDVVWKGSSLCHQWLLCLLLGPNMDNYVTTVHQYHSTGLHQFSIVGVSTCRTRCKNDHYLQSHVISLLDSEGAVLSKEHTPSSICKL